VSDDLLTAYRHDTHKLTGERHEHAAETFRGVEVNQSVPRGADGDAAALSRPTTSHSQTVPTHDTNRRLSLLTGRPVGEPDSSSEEHVADLVTVGDATTAHERWLGTDVAARFNEAAYYPYTSLKYHTLLVAALLDNYRSGHGFQALQLLIDLPGEVVPFRTVFAGSRFALRIDTAEAEIPSARLGDSPCRSWASTWGRLSEHPLDTGNHYDRVLDANLRRIRAWSTALQYLEEFDGWRSDR